VTTIRKIAGALAIVAVGFGVPVLATLLAGKVGLPHRVVGWLTLLLMCVLAYLFRERLRNLLFGRDKLPPARPRRSSKRF
jgi:hypothetical protein